MKTTAAYSFLFYGFLLCTPVLSELKSRPAAHVHAILPCTPVASTAVRSEIASDNQLHKSACQPEDLHAFQGYYLGETVSLQWKLALHNELSNVTVEKSENGREFVQIQALYNEEVSNYQYDDHQVTGKPLFYRLRLTDINGADHMSEVLVLKPSGDAGSLQIFPTVVTGPSFSARVQVSAPQVASLTFFDINGRVHYQKNMPLQAGTNTLTINTAAAGQLQGDFIVCIRTDDRLQSSRVIFP